MSMRTPELETEYQAAIKAGELITIYDEQLVKDYKYWRIVNNRFPHNHIAITNHMIVLKRICPTLLHIQFREWYELIQIIGQIKSDYDTFTYNLPATSSVKDIPHAHLYKLKKELK